MGGYNEPPSAASQVPLAIKVPPESCENYVTSRVTAHALTEAGGKCAGAWLQTGWCTAPSTGGKGIGAWYWKERERRCLAEETLAEISLLEGVDKITHTSQPPRRLFITSPQLWRVRAIILISGLMLLGPVIRAIN